MKYLFRISYFNTNNFLHINFSDTHEKMLGKMQNSSNVSSAHQDSNIFYIIGVFIELYNEFI